MSPTSHPEPYPKIFEDKNLEMTFIISNNIQVHILILTIIILMFFMFIDALMFGVTINKNLGKSFVPRSGSIDT